MREVRITDSLTGELRTVEPGPDGRVGIYACGPTTYGPIHVGNARPFVVFSLLRRLLDQLGYESELVINITDVNDKIYIAAREQGVDSATHAERMIAAYIAETDRLGLGRPDHEPKATETIEPIVAMIAELIERDHAYSTGGDVYFRVRSFPAYGRLSNRDPDQMDQGEETGSAELKEDPLDFALWKARKGTEDTAWPSPWGEGRPGWHIECSAMAEALLGLEFSIHGGGSDLLFPHHENEIAQTEAARGRAPAKLWMHNGMIETAGDKMSKSVGNIFLLGEAIDRFGAEAVVGFLLSGHYRQPITFSAEALEAAGRRNQRIRELFRSVEPTGGERDPLVGERQEAFLAALADDFNTPRAFAELAGLVTEARRGPLAGAHEAIRSMLGLLGLESLAAVSQASPDADAEAQALLAARESARAARDFARADEIRDQLAELGWEVRDTAEGARLMPRS